VNLSIFFLNFFNIVKIWLTVHLLQKSFFSLKFKMAEKFNMESFSGRFTYIGRGFIKILETWQFGLSFNIIRHVFFCFGQKKFLVGFMNFGLEQKNR
jgi:hypothetical protein